MNNSLVIKSVEVIQINLHLKIFFIEVTTSNKSVNLYIAYIYHRIIVEKKEVCVVES